MLLSSLFQNLINYSFWMMIMSSLRLKTYFTRSFQHSVSILTNISTFFLHHLLKIRKIPSPAKHEQTKITQQQLHSRLKRVHVSRFPVVSNEAIQVLAMSLWINILLSYLSASVKDQHDAIHSRTSSAFTQVTWLGTKYKL